MHSPIWRCPACRGALEGAHEALGCAACGRGFHVVDGIPDLRLPQPSWVDHDADREQARRLVETAGHLPVERMIRHVFGARPGWSEREIGRRTEEILRAPERLRRDLSGWLAPVVEGTGPFLDLGCGPGSLLAAAAAQGRRGIGIDVSLVWLVVARRLARAQDGDADVAAGMAEALPLGDGSVSGVVSLDVMEHVGDQGRYFQEIGRVLRPGGSAAFVTPNRFSLSAEPHVGVWGVGWLPRAWQRRYVLLRSGKPYDFARLLSAWEARRLVRRHSPLRPTTAVAPIPEDDITRFSAPKAALARGYNRLVSLPLVRPMVLPICPFFRLVARKGGAPEP